MARPKVPFVKGALNARLPPVANQFSLPYRLTVMSGHKMASAMCSANPDLRRCVGHRDVLRRSIERAHEETLDKIRTMKLDDEEELEGTEPANVQAMESRLQKLHANRGPRVRGSLSGVRISTRKRPQPTAAAPPPPSVKMPAPRQSMLFHQSASQNQPLAELPSLPAGETETSTVIVEDLQRQRRSRPKRDSYFSSDRALWVTAAG